MPLTVFKPGSATGFLSGEFHIQPDGREALQLSAVLWIGVLAFVYAGALILGNLKSPSEFLGPVAGTVTGVGIGYGLYLCLALLVGRPRWLAYAALTLAVVACGAAQTGADYGAHILLNLVMPDMRIPARDLQSVLVVGVVYCCLYATNLALIWLTSANRALRAQTARAAQAEAEGLRAELHALRLKLEPHFMFNALGAAAGLAGAGRFIETETMLLKLSDFLRSSLEVGTEDITLGDELSLVQEYLEVERVRFPERLQLDMDIAPEVEEALTPSLLIQPIVENAVKYGVAPSREPVTITVSAQKQADQMVIVVENDGRAVAKGPVIGTGTGLSATRERLRIRHGDKASLDAGPTEGGYRVRIALPLSFA